LKRYTDLSRDEINSLPLRSYSGKIILVEDRQRLNRAVRELLHYDVAGFDTEAKPSFVKGTHHPISLVQLAVDNAVFLFRLNKIGFPDEVVRILETKQMRKVAIGPKDDIRGLRQIRDFVPGGFVDLRQISKKLGIKKSNLRYLTALFLGFRISKSKQTSNWEAENLSSGQINYAATDAWASLQLYYFFLRNTYI